MTRSALAVVLLAALVLAGCSSTKTSPPAGLMIIVSTDLSAPRDYDEIQIQVSQQSGTAAWHLLLNQEYLVPQETQLPATVAIDPGPSGNDEVLIRVVALLDGAPVVLREAQTQVPTNRLAEIRLVLAAVCEGFVTTAGADGGFESTCGAGSSCQPLTGACGGDLVDPASLPSFAQGDVAADASAFALAADGASTDATVTQSPEGAAPPVTDGGGGEASGENDSGCGGGQLDCADACVADDVHNCGTCGHDCTSLANVTGSVSCSAGQCVVPASSCAVGFAHCSTNPDDGCEVNITLPANCGGCGIECGDGGTPVCSGSGGTYACASGCSAGAPTLCGGSCVNTMTDSQNCDACNHACTTSVAHAASQCSGGACAVVCNADYSACGGSTPCAYDTSTDATHCGASCTACPVPANGTASCSAGTCGIACSAGYTLCGSACVNEQTDPTHCGSCSNACATTTPATGCFSGYCAQVLQIAAGGSFTCMLTAVAAPAGEDAQGEVQCWGNQASGQTGVVSSTPSTAPGGLIGDSTGQAMTDVMQIAVGDSHACALRYGADVWCWGDNTYGQLGNGATLPGSPVTLATEVSLGDYVVTAITAGGNRTCANDEESLIFCWGQGYLGNGSTGNSSTYVEVGNLVGNVTSVSMGVSTCLDDNSSIECFGVNAYGQLGTGNTTNEVYIEQQQGNGGIVAVGAQHACATEGSGVVCWGDDQYSALGSATVTGTCNSEPCSTSGVVALTGSVTGLAAGFQSTCAVMSAGTVECWGDDQSGQLGNGTQETSVATPAAVSNLSGVSAISAEASGSHYCALLTNGDAVCWGSNQYGQLGIGNTTNSPVPVYVP